jgi:ribosomal-protein-alanine N-acetyltransferase
LCRGRGIATDSVKAVSQYGFEMLDLHRIYAEPYAVNLTSVRVLEMAGFMLDGILNENAFKEGRSLDYLLYAKINEVVVQPKGGK